MNQNSFFTAHVKLKNRRRFIKNCSNSQRRVRYDWLNWKWSGNNTDYRLNISIILSFCVIASCATRQSNILIRFQKQKSTSAFTANDYSINIPNGYKIITLIGGHKELEKQYIYQDSAKLYVSDFENGSLNYKNILLLGDSIASKRFKNNELKAAIAKELGKEYNPGKTTLTGQTPDGLYWKDVSRVNVNVGYINVKGADKVKFDKALSSFKER